MSLSAQWDVGNSLFGAASGLRALASILSKEEVSMQAGVACDSIGARLYVDEALHGDAVVALNGNESVRLAGMKLFIGLQNGSLAQALRGSPSCVRTFLLVAALKGCSYEEQEIADILYEMMRTTGLLSQVAVAPRQLRSMVKAVSGNAERMLESFIDSNMKIVTALARSTVPCTQASWAKIPEKDMGKLLTKAFDAIQTDEFVCTELSGDTGLIRIASVMLWLIPEETGLFAGETCIVGAQDGKLRIKCADPSPSNRADDSSWTVKNWTALKSSISFISGDPDDEEFVRPHPYTNTIPLRATRQYYANLPVSVGGVDSLGGFAAALLDCVFDYGMALPYDTDMFLQEPKRWAKAIIYDSVPLRKLWPPAFLQSLKQSGGLWESVGWSSAAIEQSRLPVWQILSIHIEAERATMAKRLSQRLAELDEVDHKDDFDKTSPRSRVFSGSAVREVFKNAVSKYWPSPNTVEQLLLHIETLVASALVISQQRPIGNIAQFFNPATPGDWIWNAIGPVGCNLPELAELCLKASVDASNVALEMKANLAPIMFASHGRVAFPYVLHGHSCLQEDALAVSVLAGYMRYNERVYDLVVETSRTKDTPSSLQKQQQHSAAAALELAQARPGASIDDSSTPFNLPANTNETRLSHLIAEIETYLFLKTRLSSKTHPDRAQFTYVVSYKDTALNLAAAERMDDETWHGIHNMDRNIPATFLEQIHVVECESQFRDQIQPNGVDRIVTKMPHDQAQRFFAADPLFCGRPWEQKLRVQQFMPIADCVKMMLKDEGVASRLITRGVFSDFTQLSLYNKGP